MIVALIFSTAVVMLLISKIESDVKKLRRRITELEKATGVIPDFKDVL